MNTTSTKFSVEQVVDGVLANFGTELNAGMIAKAVNAALLVLEVKETETVDGVEKVTDYQITPQMMNNYGSKGTFDGVKHDSMKGVVFAVDGVRTWMIKFVGNKINGTVTRGKGVPAADIAQAVLAKLGAPKQVIVADEAPKTAQTVKAAPAAQAKK